MFEEYTVTVVGGEGSVAVPGKSEFGRPWGSEMGALGCIKDWGVCGGRNWERLGEPAITVPLVVRLDCPGLRAEVQGGQLVAYCSS